MTNIYHATPYDISVAGFYFKNYAEYTAKAATHRNEYSGSYIYDTGMLSEIPSSLRFYFDFKAFARDMVLNDDIAEIEINNTKYIVQAC